MTKENHADGPFSEERPLADFAPELGRLTGDVLYRGMWQRTELSAKERSLITIAALMTAGNTDELPYHLEFAKRNGNTEDEVIEAITHLAFYAGWPKAIAAMGVAQRVYRGE